MKNQKNLLQKLKNEAGVLDLRALQSFCTVFALIGSFMCVLNLTVHSWGMAAITGGIGVLMLIDLALLQIWHHTRFVVVNIAASMMVMMLYFVVNGGEHLSPKVTLKKIDLLIYLGCMCTIFLNSTSRMLS